MARVMTFATKFPKFHPRAGEPTHFVEKIRDGEKIHTIRAGHRWHYLDKFSPRYWTGLPYRSKQAKIFESDLEVVKTFNFAIDEETGVITINSRYPDEGTIDRIAENDGLSYFDFLNWFMTGKPFDGQIICWKEVKY